METGEEFDQFQLLEEKIDSLIEFMVSVKKENESLGEKIRIQEEKIVDLNREVEHMRTAGDKAKQRIVALLEKIEQLDI
ncbi:cell division protein ZapB [bacterium]|nr:cell division protein ZapB [bacterium]